MAVLACQGVGHTATPKVAGPLFSAPPQNIGERRFEADLLEGVREVSSFSASRHSQQSEVAAALEPHLCRLQALARMVPCTSANANQSNGHGCSRQAYGGQASAQRQGSVAYRL